MNKEERRSWHGAGADLEFEPSDFEVVDLVLGQIPELRICATALKRARAAKLTFPINEPKSLFGLFQGKKFKGGGHEFGTDEAVTYMPPEFFPINHEGELVSRMYTALVRCKHEAASKVHASLDALKNQQPATHERSK
jgi:hypothetical protein